MSDISVGSKVKIVREVKSNDPDGMGEGKEWRNSWTYRMSEALGKEGIVEFISGRTGVRIAGIPFSYPLAALELVEEEMKPFELKPFMRVQLAESNDVYVVVRSEDAGIEYVDSEFIGITYGGWVELDLNETDKWRIVKVFDKPTFGVLSLWDTKYGAEGLDLVWEEKPVVDTEFQKRIDYYQTHIDALEENLASLQAELTELKREANGKN